MKTSILILTAVMLLVITARNAFGKDLTRQLEINGMKRQYSVHVPRNGTLDSALPVVLVLHGAASSPAMAKWVSRMSKQADKDGFYAVYPRGTALGLGMLRTWNAGECCGPARTRKVDDVGFVRAVIEDMEQNFKIDSRRMFVAGMSNGAMMAYRIGVELSDTVAAIGVVEGAMFCQKQKTESPVSLVVFHGERDTVVPITGGIGRWFIHRFQCPALKDSIEFWVKNNDCSSTPHRETIGDTVRMTFAGGRDDTEVVLYQYAKGHHFWPGGRLLVSPRSTDDKVSATEAMCEFFLRHPKGNSD